MTGHIGQLRSEGKMNNMLTREVCQNIQNASTQQSGSLKLNGRVRGAMFDEVENGADQTAELEDTDGDHI